MTTAKSEQCFVSKARLNLLKEMIFYVRGMTFLQNIFFQTVIAQVVSSNPWSLAEFDKFPAAVIFQLYVY